MAIEDISLSVEADKPLPSLRKMVMADLLFVLQESEKIRALAESYVDEDDEPDDSGIKHKKKKPKPEINFMMYH